MVRISEKRISNRTYISSTTNTDQADNADQTYYIK